MRYAPGSLRTRSANIRNVRIDHDLRVRRNRRLRSQVSEEGRMPLVPTTATRTKTSVGRSTTSYQDALDKAIAAALRAAGGADRSISWTVKSVSGTAGGIK